MSPTLIRVIAFFLFMLLGGSFFPILFDSSVPFLAILLSFSATLSLMHGFRQIWPAVLVVGLFADIATLSPLGILGAFSIGISYVASFASHRIVTEHSLLLFLFGGFAVSVTSSIFLWVSGMISGGDFEVTWIALWPAFVSGFITFPLVFLSFRRFDYWVSSFEAPHL